MSSPVLISDEQEKLAEVSSEVSAVVARAEAIQVSTPDEALDAAGFLAEIKAAKTRSEQARMFLVGPLNEQVKRINAVFKDTAVPLAVADRLVRGKVLGFHQEQQQLREREQARLDAERKQAEEQAAVERQQAEEAAWRAEREAREAERDAAGTDTPSDAQQLAVKARQQAEEATQRSIAVQAAPTIQVAVPRLSNLAAVRREWRATAIDRAKLPDEYLIVDEARINREVKAGAREIPGVTIEQVAGLSVRVQ